MEDSYKFSRSHILLIRIYSLTLLLHDKEKEEESPTVAAQLREIKLFDLQYMYVHGLYMYLGPASFIIKASSNDIYLMPFF